VRDGQGVPHIFAQDMTAAMYGLGYAMAQDRLLQMELKRRTMRGQMAEAFGAGENNRWLQLDKFNRTVGHAQHAEQIATTLPTDIIEWLQAYADGVNAYVTSDDFTLPAEVTAANIDSFAPWSVADAILARDFLTNFFGKNGVEHVMSSESSYQVTPTTCSSPPIDEAAAVVPNPLQASAIGAAQDRAERSFKASHSWVVAGWRNSEGGSSVLHSNPQLPVQAPSYLYEYHLSTPDLDVRGAGFSGAPGFLVFWNQHLSTGGSSAGGDFADLFQLDADADSYSIDGESKSFVERTETIRVAGAADETITVRESELGPVVSDLMDTPNTYALRHVELVREDSHSLVGALRMMTATNTEQLRAAIGEWAAPCLNVIYGDKDGNIGYQPACMVPRRATDLNEAPGRQPFDGSLSAQDWDGFYGIDEMPHVENPAEGYIITANHLPVGSWFPHYTGMNGSGETGRSHRLRTIFQHLLPDPSATITPDQVRAIQDDAGSESVRGFLLALRHLHALGVLKASSTPTTPAEKAYATLSVLEHWGGSTAKALEVYPGAQLVTSDSVFALTSWLAQMLAKQFRFDADNPLKCLYGGASAGLAYFQKSFALDPEGVMSDPNNPAHVAALDYHLVMAAAAFDAVVSKMPADLSSWPTDDVSYTVPHHYDYQCFGEPDCSITTCTFGGEPAACSLDPSATFSATLYAPVIQTLRSQAGNAYSHWVWHDQLDEARSLTPPGTSENPDDPSFQTNLSAWENGEMFAAPMTRELIDADATLTLMSP